MFEETRRCPGISGALFGMGGKSRARKWVDSTTLSKGCQGGWDRWRYGLSLVQVRNQPPHLLQGLSLHQDIVLGQEESGYFGEFSHRGAVGVGDDSAQAIQCVVQVMHPPPLPGVNAEPQRPLLLGLFAEGPPGLIVPKWRASLPRLKRIEAVLVVARVLSAALVGLRGLPGEEVGGRCEREPSGTPRDCAGAEPEGWLAVALRQVEERVVADGLEQVLFADIHFLFQSSFWPGKVYSSACFSILTLVLKTVFCTHVVLSKSCGFLGVSLFSLLSSVSVVILQERGCESEALQAFTSSVLCAPPSLRAEPTFNNTSLIVLGEIGALVSPSYGRFPLALLSCPPSPWADCDSRSALLAS